MVKRIISIVCIVCVIISMMTLPAFAAYNVWEMTDNTNYYYTGGYCNLISYVMESITEAKLCRAYGAFYKADYTAGVPTGYTKGKVTAMVGSSVSAVAYATASNGYKAIATTSTEAKGLAKTFYDLV